MFDLTPVNTLLQASGAKKEVVHRIAAKLNGGKTDLIYKVLGGRSKNLLIAKELIKEAHEIKKLQEEINALGL